MTNKKETGVILKTLRINANKTRADIADILCVSQGAVAKYEEGKNRVPPDNVPLYAEALNVDTMDFLRLTGHMPADLPVPVWRENGKWRIGEKRKERNNIVKEKTVDIERKAMKDGLGNGDLVEMAEDIIRYTNMDKEEMFGADRIRVETSALAAVIMYIYDYTTYGNKIVRNFGRLLAAGAEDDRWDDEQYRTPLQYIFDEVERYDSEAQSLACYEAYMAAPKYLRRTAVSCLLARLSNPNFPDEFWDRYFEDLDDARADEEDRAAKTVTEESKKEKGEEESSSNV